MTRRFFARLLSVVLLAVGVPVAIAAAPASAAAEWLDGAFANSSVLNCPSMIFGSPYYENGMMTYVGYYGDMSSSSPNPAVGQNFLVHVVVGGVGNPCAGQYAQPTLVLPAGLTVLGATCLGTLNNATNPQACTPVLSNGRYYFQYVDAGKANTIWPVPTGATWDLRLTVRASAEVVGQLQGVISTADGNGNPTLTPTAAIYVRPTGTGGAAQTQISYPTPSTLITPGNPATHESRGYVVAPSAGTVRFDIGLAANSYSGSVTGPISGAGTWLSRITWSPVTQGTTYHWRMCFTPTSSTTTCGTDQSFTVIASDSTAPTVTSVTLINNAHAGTVGDPITSPTITYRFTFSEPVTGFEAHLIASAPNLTLPNPENVVITPRSGDQPVYSSTYTVTVPSGIGTGTHTLGIMSGSPVKDAAGNALANSMSKTVNINRLTADVGAPTITTTALPATSLGSAFTQAWTASDAGSGLGFFTVQSRALAVGGTATPWSTPGTVVGPALRSASIAISAGTTRCTRVTATDASSNSATGATRCTTAPVDDRGTRATGSWSSLASTSAYKRTLSRSTVVGSTRYLLGAKVKRVIVVAEKRPGAGTIEVRVNGVVRGTYSLASSTIRAKQPIDVTLPAVVSGARVDVRVKTVGTGVRIDGLGVAPS